MVVNGVPSDEWKIGDPHKRDDINLGMQNNNELTITSINLWVYKWHNRRWAVPSQLGRNSSG